ncbi:phage tail tube protein [Pseudomonas putida]|uniref:Ig domain protein, group 2 domain protein n=1 Tax=Pseudomonas putida (strain ATCC 700007 / DSM 6899 / JCM 31910 / BCRC 17059 / LMG 24140 / F1) TaxID=351746 RepID=A5W5T6_PSEP1|nr:phage tail tube protein [Pseudomonas putida]MDD2001475.1 phage tail tube protein [Pseudomonas putida]HDS1791422.1 Ig domain-containing protein [Pseudomonas putida]
MSSGAKVQLAWIKEVTPGFTPDGDWNVLTRISNGLMPTFNSEENNEIGFTRMSQGTAQTTVDVGGDIETKWRFGALDDFMASCFGKDWAGNVLTMGDDRITFSIASYATDIGVSAIARGVQVANMNFDFPGDNEVTVTMTMAARSWDDKGDNTSFIINAQPEASQRRFSFKDISGLKINGVQVGEGNACVDSFNLQFDNNVQTQRCIGNGNPYPGNIIATTFTPSGAITISWSKMAYELWKAQKGNDAISLEFTIGNADGGYQFMIPEMEVTADWPDGGSTDIIQVELNYTARRVAPTITRLPTPIVVAAVDVTPATLSLEAGDTGDLEVVVTPAGASQQVTWTSSAPTIASVSETGLVTALAVGAATITATSVADGTKTDTCAVTVTA